MSDAQHPQVSGNVLVICATVVILGIAAAVVFIAVGVEESQNPAGVISLFLTGVGSLIASVAALFKVGQVAKQTSDLTNGKMDQKIESGVHRAMDNRES